MAKVSLRAYNQEIETMIDRGHLDEAIAHCRHILKTFPKHLETYRLLGKAYLEYKRFPEAADIFSRVLVSDPNDFVANVGMSIIRDEENKLDEAVWHMERAFETQPSNAAIQSELQRLYTRREGVAPPRIRMTRGALAHMYVQGELYPQAISEIKSVLKEDPGRSDMQVLLARAYYRSGLKNDAADVASTVLRSNPYNLDANRVLVEILDADRPESAQAYRQRVVELDPYAAQVASSIFLSNEVPDAAVTIEHLDWNGQPVGMQPDWQATQAISLESGPRQDEQPDWLKNALGETTSPQTPAFDQPQSRSVPAFDAAPPSAQPVEPVDDLPDFLRAAGWGASTGAFDESKSGLTDNDPASSEAPIEQGDLPDWVKAMAPQQPAETPAEEEEELPDWINKIGASTLPVASESSDELDWMKPVEQPAAQPADDQPDWLKQLGASEQPASAAAEEQPDWLKGFGSEAESTPATAPADDLDWLGQLSKGEGTEAKSVEPFSGDFDFLNQPLPSTESTQETPAASDEFDFLSQLGAQPETASAPSSSDDFDFLNPLGSQSTSAASTDDFEFLNELSSEPEQIAPSTPPEPARAGPLGMSEEEQDDSFAWLESLAAKQGATEGLLTKPEERLEEEPDWVKQAKGMDMGVGEPPAEVEEPPVTQPAGNLEELGKSEQEQDDSFAWLEGLAAKQGATEGLLTKPEERLEQEPDWVQQAKDLGTRSSEIPTQPRPKETPAVPEPAASVEDLGKSEREQDDAFAWLESLAAKQGANEGLLTKPEERPADEPEWVKQAKDMGESLELAPEETVSADDTGIWLRSLDEETSGTQPQELSEERVDFPAQEEQVPTPESLLTTPIAEQPSSSDDTAAWLRSLEQEETSLPQAQESSDEIPAWLGKEEEPRAEEPSLTAAAEESAHVDETEVWLRELEGRELESQAGGQLEEQPDVPAEEITPTTPVAEEPVTLYEEETPSVTFSRDDTAIWLKSLDKEEEPAPQPAEATPAEDLPAWMQSLEQEQGSVEEEAAISAAAAETAQASEWISEIEDQPARVVPETPKVDTGSLPSWLRGLEEEEAREPAFGAQEDLPAWLRDETGEVVAEPPTIEPMRPTEWQPLEAETRQPELVEQEPEPIVPEPVAEQPQSQPVAVEPIAPPSQPEPVDVVAIIEEKIVAAEPEMIAAPSKPPKEPPARKVTGTLGDPVLGQARSELSRSNISSALDNYGRLIKKGRFLEDIIYDLREASYRYPVDVGIWQSLGDAYMRANRLQDALDAYTKAEELLR